MKLQELRIALIGCGRVAGHHCLSISRTKGARLVAVCDLAIERAQKYGEQYKVPNYNNYHEMLRRHPDINLVVIITPSGMHAEHASEVIEVYKKHILVEKPTFMTPCQANSTFNLGLKNNVEVFPVFQNRYNKAVKRVQQAILRGELGDIRVISVRVRWCRPQKYYDMASWRGTYSHDGGALANQGIHHLDLLRYLGGEVTRVNATMRTLGVDVEVEDTVVATIDYESGALGVIECTTAARPDDFEASFSIVGEKGLAQIGGVAVNELQYFSPAPEECPLFSEDFKGVEGQGAVYGFGHFQVYRDVVGHLIGDLPYPIGREDCLGTLHLLHAFYKSDEDNKWILVDDKNQSKRLGFSNDKISDLYRTPKPIN